MINQELIEFIRQKKSEKLLEEEAVMKRRASGERLLKDTADRGRIAGYMECIADLKKFLQGGQ